MRVARASLRDGKRVDSQGFKFRAYLGDGQDESGFPGTGAGPHWTRGTRTPQSRFQAPGQRKLVCGGRRQEEILRPARGPTRSLAGLKQERVYTTAKGSGHQVQTGQAGAPEPEDGGSEEAISDKSASGRGSITGKEWGGRSKECARNPYEWGT